VLQLEMLGTAAKKLLPVCTIALLFGACSFPGASTQQASRVDVDTLPTNILYGAATQTALAGPAAAGPAAPAPLQPLPPATVEQPLSQFFQGNNFNFQLPTASFCPAAPSTAAPAQAAPSDVSTLPASGQYRWVTSGTYDLVVLPLTVQIPLLAFQERYVRKAARIKSTIPSLPGAAADFDFTYQTIEPRVSKPGFYLMYWQVKDEATSVAGANTALADPEGGLALKQIDELDKDGKDTGTIFMGTPGLLLLPLPAQNGASVNSASTDATHGLNLSFKGSVGNRERVDACGQFIQAWPVDGTLTTAGAGGGTGVKATIHLDVATQFGALLVAFNVDGNYLATTYHGAKLHVGQVKPDPLPQQYQ